MLSVPESSKDAVKTKSPSSEFLLQEGAKKTYIRTIDAESHNVREFIFFNTQPKSHGTFGVVSESRDLVTGERCAIKTVCVDNRYKTRELYVSSIMNHINVCKLKAYFYSEDKSKTYMNLVMEYLPLTLYNILQDADKAQKRIPTEVIQVTMFQVFRGLAHVHSMNICHRDIKPHNILWDSQRGLVKLCDFGSAKTIKSGEKSVSYICSRYYRAPELVLGHEDYGLDIDIWSVGCVLGEMFICDVLFKPKSIQEHLEMIVALLLSSPKTTESAIESLKMEAKITHDIPEGSFSWKRLLRDRLSDSILDLLERCLAYPPNSRLRPIRCLTQSFFFPLRGFPAGKTCKGVFINENLLKFTQAEIEQNPQLPYIFPKARDLRGGQI